MIEIVKELYLASWDESLARIPELITSKEEAERISNALIKSPGWRERVSAAKIITAYSLYSLAEPLVETFFAVKETYTAMAFATMLKTLNAPNADATLERMINSCDDSDYGKRLKQVINDARPA